MPTAHLDFMPTGYYQYDTVDNLHSTVYNKDVMTENVLVELQLLALGAYAEAAVGFLLLLSSAKTILPTIGAGVASMCVCVCITKPRLVKY